MNDHKYVDVTYLNNASDKLPKPIIFDQYKDAPFIYGDTNDYYMSITRFSLNNTTLPVIIPDVKTFLPDGMNPLGMPIENADIYTNYNIDLGIGTAPAQAVWASGGISTVKFVPQLYPSIHKVPSYYPKTVPELYADPYYRITSIQHFLNMINAALDISFYTLKAMTDYAAILAKALPPKFIWNGSKIELLYTDEYIQTLYDFPTFATNTLFIGMNTNLYNLLASFNMTQIFPPSSTPLVDSIDYFINIRDKYSKDTILIKGPTGTTIALNSQEQEYSSVPFWSPIETIFFTTSSLPVSLSANLGTTFTGDNYANLASGNTNATVISDFVYDQTLGTEMLGSLSYIATGEYRLYDLDSSIDIKQLRITCWWKDKNGGNHMMYAPYGSGANMKILFRRKQFGNIN